jgi:hypothetical protein
VSDELTYEELEQPRRSRIGSVLLALLVAAGAVVVVVRASGPDPATRPAGSALRPGKAASSGVTAPPLPIRVPMPFVVEPYRQPRRCPMATDGQDACSTYPTVSARFVRAVRVEFPELAVRSAVTQLLRATGPEVRPAVWSVEFVGVTTAVRLRIAVSRAEPPDRAAAGMVLGVGQPGEPFVFIRAVRAGFTVQIEAVSRVNRSPGRAALTRLAADPRLLRPPAATMDR